MFVKRIMLNVPGASGSTMGAETEIAFIPRHRDKADEVRLSEERQSFQHKPDPRWEGFVKLYVVQATANYTY